MRIMWLEAWRGTGLGMCLAVWLGVLASSGCSRGNATNAAAPENAAHARTPYTSNNVPSTKSPSASGDPQLGYTSGVYRGFDRNDYPGDSAMQGLHSTFAFTGYWLTNPPGEKSNSWVGRRAVLGQQGWGFLVLANGRLDAEILKAQRSKIAPAGLAGRDAAIAIAAAQREGFPAHTILFLDQEEGGRLLDEQAAYLLAWTEAVAASNFRPGLYASGQPVPDSPPNVKPAKTITTINDVRTRVTAGHLHPIAIFDYQDACPPAPGCTLQARPLNASGESILNPAGDLIAWQYAQSPRRPDITKSCAKTYASDNNCYAPGSSTLFLDMDAASSPDPSHGR
jgi:hypothetical protein